MTILRRFIILLVTLTSWSTTMAAMKPRTGDGPMEAIREKRDLIIVKVPAEGGGRLVFSLKDEEAVALRDALNGVTK
jgi:hypothetical protein